MKFSFFSFFLSRTLLHSWMHKKKYRGGSSVGIVIPFLGVAVGVIGFFVVLSIMSGFVQNIQKGLLEFTPSLTIVSQDKFGNIKQDQKVLAQMKQLSPEILSVVGVVRSPVLFQTPTRMATGDLIGVDPADHFNLLDFVNTQQATLNLGEEMRAPQVRHSQKFPTLILGDVLQEDLDAHWGDPVTLVSTDLEGGDTGSFGPTQMPLLVNGVLSTGQFSVDRKTALMSLESANRFLGTPGTWNAFFVQLKDPFIAQEISAQINVKLNKMGLVAIPWTKNSQTLLSALQLEHYGMGFVMGMIILVGCFSITISLLLSVRRKSNEMAILRALGLSRKDLFRVYLYQGMVIGFFGVVFGLLVGSGVLYLLGHCSFPALTGGYTSGPLPVHVNSDEIVFLSIASFLLSILASVWPALEVKNLNIIEILNLRA